ncbi:hypothetical protein JY446_02835 [Serratia marcescens]|uniref:hypothetical protein n=1 Tax=Serratia TaxID=613 RepID=UPI00100899EF|nr:hypothetical protein [Serratia marcescens]ELH4239426.1 hypothetical protein [Serratia marcescens]ELH4244787.1 hypothetical protein [Serratia marcescens]EMB4122961.1 hypothetical protein [Serratia marcescens]EMC1043187.1 hypothetical protein [Serratia marcescens]MBH1881060.1 hypothetical protein [Serratia marcescens]
MNPSGAGFSTSVTMRRQPAREGIVDVAGLMNVKTVDEQPRKQQRQQACHKNDGDHFLHNFIPFPVGLNLLLFVFARNFRSTWVKILVLIVFFSTLAA